MVKDYDPRFKLFMLILILIGIIACFFVPVVSINITAELYSGTASPYNLDWMGTTAFKDILVEKGYKVFIVDDWSKVSRLVENDSLLVFIAPDKPIPLSISKEVFKLVVDKRVNLLIADENDTSNNLLNMFGLRVTGHAILVGGKTETGEMVSSPFPRTVMYPGTGDTKYILENYSIVKYNYIKFLLKRYYPVKTIGKRYVFRLNWASNIEFTKPLVTDNTSSINMSINISYYIVGYTRGFLDYNDSGLLEVDELNSFGEKITGLWVVVNNSSKIVVYSDSFIFTNQALESNNTVYKEYVLDLIESLNIGSKKVIIFNGFYNLLKQRITVPYHPSIVLYFLATFLKTANDVITGLVNKHVFSAFIFSIALISILTIMLAYMTSSRKYREVSVGIVDETRVISETVIKKSVIEGKGVDARKTIQGIWKILNYSAKKMLGYNVRDALINRELMIDFSKTIGVEEEKLSKTLGWLYSVYLKSIGKKRLPIILSWNRALRKYINYSEYILEHMGYTITREAGYRGVESILH